jgi:hypothetical protein
MTLVLDLTERKQLEQALAERVAQLETVMEAVPHALLGPVGKSYHLPLGRVEKSSWPVQFRSGDTLRHHPSGSHSTL